MEHNWWVKWMVWVNLITKTKGHNPILKGCLITVWWFSCAGTEGPLHNQVQYAGKSLNNSTLILQCAARLCLSFQMSHCGKIAKIEGFCQEFKHFQIHFPDIELPELVCILAAFAKNKQESEIIFANQYCRKTASLFAKAQKTIKARPSWNTPLLLHSVLHDRKKSSLDKSVSEFPKRKDNLLNNSEFNLIQFICIALLSQSSFRKYRNRKKL